METETVIQTQEPENQKNQNRRREEKRNDAHYIKQLFKGYRRLCLEIERMEMEITSFRLSKQSAGAQQLTGMPHGSGMGDMMTEYISKVSDMEFKLLQKKIMLVDRRDIIEGYLDKLHGNERLIMELHYVDGMSWEAIALRMNYHTNSVLYIHGKTLTKLASL